MQKIINVLAVTSFVVSGTIVGGGIYIFMNKDTILDDVKTKISKTVMESVTSSLPGLVDSAIPELPNATGNILPSTTGISIPLQ